eukprot:689945-Alexandrium_andersonii.AAC.1
MPPPPCQTRKLGLGSLRGNRFSVPPTGPAIKKLLHEALQGASPGGLPPPGPPRLAPPARAA